jgi:hypothetical protein
MARVDKGEGGPRADRVWAALGFEHRRPIELEADGDTSSSWAPRSNIRPLVLGNYSVHTSTRARSGRGGNQSHWPAASPRAVNINPS